MTKFDMFSTAYVISQHGWMRQEHADENGGLERKVFIEGLKNRFDVKDDMAQAALDFALKHVIGFYQEGSKIYFIPRGKRKPAKPLRK